MKIQRMVEEIDPIPSAPLGPPLPREGEKPSYVKHGPTEVLKPGFSKDPMTGGLVYDPLKGGTLPKLEEKPVLEEKHWCIPNLSAHFAVPTAEIAQNPKLWARKFCQSRKLSEEGIFAILASWFPKESA